MSDVVLYTSTGFCDCGGHEFISAIYITEDNFGDWSVMIEEQCHECGRLDLTQKPLIDCAAAMSLEQHENDLEKSDQDE